MAHLKVVSDGRSVHDRRSAIEAARSEPAAVALLSEAIGHLEAVVRSHGANPWEDLDAAYGAIDRYLAFVIEHAALEPSCGAGCSACCHDAPQTLPVEGVRLVRQLRATAGGAERIQTAVEHARRFQTLLAHSAASGDTTTKTQAYVEAQYAWRLLKTPCALLDDEGRCSQYERRPLACRVHISIEDPAHCDASHPRFRGRERPAIWGSEEAARCERLLAQIGDLLGLPGTPNLPWALASLHGHALAR